MTAAADRHLLFGLLALQTGIINQGQLVAAFQAWTLDTSRGLADHLESRGDLDTDDRRGGRGPGGPPPQTERREHRGQPRLARDRAATRASLARVAGPDVEASLAMVGTARPGDGGAVPATRPPDRPLAARLRRVGLRLPRRPVPTGRAPDRACGGDPVLRAEVERLLAEDERRRRGLPRHPRCGHTFSPRRRRPGNGHDRLPRRRHRQLRPPLPAPPAPRERRPGGGVRRPRHRAEPRSGAQADPRPPCRRPLQPPAVPHRGRDHRRAGAPGHRAGLQPRRLPRRPALLRDAVRQGGQPQGGDRAVPCRRGARVRPRPSVTRAAEAACGGSPTSATRSSTPTAGASCTATSSRRT